MMGPHYEALGWTLVHVGWQATVVAGLYALTDFARLRSQIRYVIGLVAMLAILVLAIGTFVYEEARLSVQPDAAVFLTFAPAPGFSLSHLMPWLDAAWISGVVAMSARMAISLWFINRLRQSSEPLPEDLSPRISAMVRRMGLAGKVQMRLHSRISGPFVVGAFRSVIYLPVSAVTALAPDQLDAVLAHELEHIRRADYLWNLTQSVIETLFFFHPAVWWLGAKLREQRELCCDDAALKVCADPLTYATALLNLEEQRRPRQMPNLTPDLAMALNGQDGGRGLMARIARMLGEKADMPRKSRPHAAFALPILLLVVAFFVTPVARGAAAVQPMTILAAVTGQHPKPAPDNTKVRVEVARVVTPQTADDDASADGIDPDAIAAQARADAEKARAEVARAAAEDIDVDAIVAEARRAAEQARQDMQRQGVQANIDVDAVAEQARAAAEHARAQMADVRNLNIDVDAIATQARASAEKAKVQVEFGKRFGRRFGTQWQSDDDAGGGATQETPAPLMDDQTASSSASPLAMISPPPAVPQVAGVPGPHPVAAPAPRAAPAIALIPLPPAPPAAPAVSICPKVKIKVVKLVTVQQS